MFKKLTIISSLPALKIFLTIIGFQDRLLNHWRNSLKQFFLKRKKSNTYNVLNFHATICTKQLLKCEFYKETQDWEGRKGKFYTAVDLFYTKDLSTGLKIKYKSVKKIKTYILFQFILCCTYINIGGNIFFLFGKKPEIGLQRTFTKVRTLMNATINFKFINKFISEFQWLIEINS